jgi:branched-chain amino acid transport system permease protein
MTARYALLAGGFGILVALTFFAPPYFMHLLIQILLWGFVYTAWSMMGRFGFVSLGHGAFMGVGAYVPALLWNYYGLTPWLGIPLGVALAVLLAVVIGYPCFRLKVVGHYFALVTLALSQVVLLSITAARDITGGSLGLTPKAAGFSWYALQFPDKRYFYVIGLLLWLGGLAIWRSIDRGIGRQVLDAISEDEEAAAAVGIDVMREKLRVTVISAALTALGGAIFGQYLRHVCDARPDRRRALDDLAQRRPAHRLRHQFHRRRQYHLRHSAHSVHYLHAARHPRRPRARRGAPRAVQSGAGGMTMRRICP